MAVSFIGGAYPEKTIDLQQVTQALSDNVVSSIPHNEWDSNS